MNWLSDPAGRPEQQAARAEGLGDLLRYSA